MDIALINPDSGDIENVIVARSVAHAQAHYPDLLCVERTTQPFEPGATIRRDVILALADDKLSASEIQFGEVIRAARSDVTE